MKKFFIGCSSLVFILLVLGAVYLLFQMNSKSVSKFETEKAFKSDIIKKTVANGSIEPRKEVELKPQVSGIIEEIYVEPGQVITKGTPVAKITIIPNMVNLNNAENRVNLSKINFNNAKFSYDRNKKLYEDGVIAPAEFQAEERNFKQASEELQAAQNNLSLIKKGSRGSSRKNSNTIIKSTISGMILDVLVEVGNSVIESNTFNDGTTVASVADMSDIIFVGKVDESEVGKIKKGMAIILDIGALENEQFDAVLDYISPKGIEENGAIQFEIKATMKIPEDATIRAGYSANASIVLDRRDSVICVNESVVIYEGDSTFVEVETGDQQFDKKPIKLGLSDGINVEVLDGVTIEERLKNPNRKKEF